MSPKYNCRMQILFTYVELLALPVSFQRHLRCFIIQIILRCNKLVIVVWNFWIFVTLTTTVKALTHLRTHTLKYLRLISHTYFLYLSVVRGSQINIFVGLFCMFVCVCELLQYTLDIYIVIFVYKIQIIKYEWLSFF